jgi:hypothetical protein
MFVQRETTFYVNTRYWCIFKQFYKVGVISGGPGLRTNTKKTTNLRTKVPLVWAQLILNLTNCLRTNIP